MESILVGGILGAGYLLGNNNKNVRQTIKNQTAYTTPSQNSIYDSDYFTKTQTIESELVNNKYDLAANGMETNIIPPEFNHSIINKQTNPIKYMQNPQIEQLKTKNSKTVLSPLTGQPVNKNAFTHNNMMPFFGSHIRQNTSENSNSSILENQTGYDNYHVKKEPVPLFEPTKDLNIIYGTQNSNDDIQNRYSTTLYRQNELPFEQVHVGPGINKGYTNLPSGGFVQDVRDYVLPKTIDELRTASNPQISYKGRVIPGGAVVGKTEQIGLVQKVRPDTFYENSADRYFTTTTTTIKEPVRSDMIMKETNRKDVNEYVGSAAPANKKNNTARSLYKKTIKTSFEPDTTRNLFSSDTWGNEEFGDYGKQSIRPVPNERDITSTRTHTSNLTTIVKAIIAPLSDIMRTTIKESNIHDNRTANIQTTSAARGTILDKEALKFKTTIRETTENDNHVGIVKGPIKLTTYDPNNIARTTIKETLIHDNRTGNLGGLNKDLGYLTNPMEAPNTNRQFTHDYEYEGIADTNRGGGGTGYLTNEQEVGNTNRQFTSDYEYEGQANSMYKKPLVYDTDYNSRTNVVKEGTLVGREPTNSNVALYVGKDTLNVENKKIEGDYINTRQMNGTKVYNSIAEVKTCSQTTDRFKTDYSIMEEQIKPDLLNAFRQNPYTKSLASYAYN